MLRLHSVLSAVIAFSIVGMYFQSFARVEEFWATIMVNLFPIVVALIGIWFGDEVDDWFGNVTAFPSWVYQLLGWLILAIEGVTTFIQWRIVAPYLAK